MVKPPMVALLAGSLLFFLASSPRSGAAPAGRGTVVAYDRGTLAGGLMRPLDVAVLDDGTAWAVGDSLQYFDGTRWSRRATLAGDLLLYGVDLTDPRHGWAVGDDGTILGFDGQSWSVAESPTDGNLYDVAMTAVDRGWAVGDSILRLDGGRWSESASLGGNRLLALSMSDANTGWAVGTVIMRCLYGHWTRFPKPSTELLMGVHSVGPDDAWAVGRDGVVLHFDGQSWREGIRVPDVDLYDVYEAADGPVWLIAGDRVLLLEGQAPREVWRLPSWTGQSKADCRSARQGSTSGPPCLTRIAVGRAAAWIVGSDGIFAQALLAGRAVALQQWNLSFSGLAASSPSQPVYMAGNGVDFGWTGSAWTITSYAQLWRMTPSRHLELVDDLQRTQLWDVDVDSSGAVWAIGQDEVGIVLRIRRSGQSPETVHLPSVAARAVAATGNGEAWVLGDSAGPGSCAIHVTTEGLTCVPLPPGSYLDVDFDGPSDGWAVGRHGAIARYSGDGWKLIEPTTDEDLGAVTVSGERAWAGGTNGYLSQLVGTTWRQVALPGRASITKISMRPDGDALIVRGTALEEPLCGEAQVQLVGLDGGVDDVVQTCADRVLDVASIGRDAALVGDRQLVAVVGLALGATPAGRLFLPLLQDP